MKRSYVLPLILILAMIAYLVYNFRQPWPGRGTPAYRWHTARMDRAPRRKLSAEERDAKMRDLMQ
jgi:hypothetical protein